MMDIVTILLQATALMLALIVLRPLLRRFLSARARCALWAIPAARLLIPVEIHGSLSIMAPAAPLSHGVSAAVSRPSGIEAPSWLGSGIGMANTAPPAAEGAAQAAAPAQLSVSGILFALWLLGALVCGGLIIWQNLRFRRFARRHGEALDMDCPLPVYLLGALPSPCLAGIFRPVIYLNRQALSSDEILKMTLLHEMTHFRRLDHIRSAIRGLLLALYWFHPLVWICSELFRADCETACDEAATRNMDNEERQSYGMALINLASRAPRGSTGRLVCLTTMNGGKELLRERISQLAGGRSFRHTLLIAVMLAAALCFTMCTVPGENAEVPSSPSPAPDSGEKTPTNAQIEAIPKENGDSAGGLSIPAQEDQGSLSDLAWFLELSVAPERSYTAMDEGRLESILDEYGGLLDGYEFIARESTDGKSAYIAGRYTGAPEESPLYHMYSVDFNMEAQVLYTEGESELVEKALSLGELPNTAHVIKGSTIHYSDGSDLILIEPADPEASLDVAFSYYVYTPNGRAYIADAVERGISIGRPEGAYLEVYLISEKFGELTERIPLTAGQLAAIRSEEKQELIPGIGFAAALCGDGDTEYYTEHTGIPQTVLDLATEKCDYRYGDPGMINDTIVEATLECSWLTEARHADPDRLPRLEEMLKNAEFGYVGRCGYGAKLTVRMQSGEMVTMFKGSDSCDSIVFGSYSGYFLGDAENTEFWDIFGLDADFWHMPIE